MLSCPHRLLAATLFAATLHSQTPETTLPVTRVSLYKNGVGFFEHTGKVTGNAQVSIAFTTAQLNDVLQSLTAIDLGGGRIAGAGYNSTMPIEQQLKALPLGLGQDADSQAFYNAIRGARVEVHSGVVAITGRLLNLEIRTAAVKEGDPAGAERRFLTVVSDAGSVRTIELTSPTEVRLLDPTLHSDVTRYLQLLANTRNQGLRRLTLQDNGPSGSTARRDLRVSYISEVPVWKSTYRILFSGPATALAKQTATLQGWSVVDNTTGTDWLNVQLSLIAGAPQSFIQPLSVPYYTRRPEIPLPQEAQLSPQTHDSGDVVQPTDGVAGMSGMGSGNGVGLGPGAGSSTGGGVYRKMDAFHGGAIGGPMSKSVAVVAAAPMIAYEDAAAQSLTPQTTTSAFDDFFAYTLDQPITIRKNESALVPILQTKVDAERVTLIDPQRQTLRALWITNTSDLTLDRGSFAIVENGSFGGEGLLDSIHPKERRLLSYAADTAVRVSTERPLSSSRTTSVTVSKGVLVFRTAEVAELEYLLHNSAAEPRTLILEHPRRQGFTLYSDPKPEETTPAAYRFRVPAAPGETVRLHVGEKRLGTTRYQLLQSDDNELTYILNESHHNPQLEAVLQPILEARRRVADAQTALTQVNERLTSLKAEEERQRANITALKEADKSARNRFVHDLNATEDQIAATQREYATADATLKAVQAGLASKITALQLDQTL